LKGINVNLATGNKILSLIRLSRPLNVLIAFMTIIVAAELAGGLDPLLHVLLAALSASLITIGANVINDYYDIQIDQINKPNRPLAAAALSPKTALIYFAVVYVYHRLCIFSFTLSL
jgi:geranylgeranylglycerol-phosphate geranylgeranyltransferase